MKYPKKLYFVIDEISIAKVAAMSLIRNQTPKKNVACNN